MQLSLSRRAFFKGRLLQSELLSIRPPWSLSESTFLDLCSRCDKCVDACESQIVKRGDGGYPTIDFSMGECTFCRACVRSCADGALVDSGTDAAPWNLGAQIAAGCLSASGVTCRVCGDRCDARAIRFQLAVGGISNPIIDSQSCTGCGACVAPCPADVISIKHNAEEAST